MFDFIAIDFETACAASAPPPCALGITIVKNGAIYKSINYYINPETEITPQCIRIHGIRNKTVVGCPTFPEIWDEIRDLFSSNPLVAHNMEFDYRVLCGSLNRYGLEIPKLKLYDTFSICNSCFPEEKTSLVSMCKRFDLEVNGHHSASSDSEMCARLFLCLQTDFASHISPFIPPVKKIHTTDPLHDLNRMLNEVQEWARTESSYPSFSAQEPNYAEANTTYDDKDGLSFEGKVFVLTGKIGEYERAELRDLISSLGGYVKSSVSKKTDYLVVGYEDKNVVSDPENAKSLKILKAEELRSKGEKIKIISDEAFLTLLENATSCSCTNE